MMEGGDFYIFDGPEPWGPWTTVAHYDDWLNAGGGCGLSYGFSNKWTSSDGLTMWLIWACHCGCNYHDQFNLIRATLTAAATNCGDSNCDTGECQTCPQDCLISQCLDDGYCSQGLQNGDENCGNSPIDCACTGSDLCCSNQCITPACSQNLDCGTNLCKTYTCSNPGTCSASCSSQDITACSGPTTSDGCCPPGCDEANDIDCTQLIISNLWVFSGLPYEWDTLAVGKDVYIDRTITYSTIPSKYLNLQYLKTANDDKQSSGSSFLSFVVSQPVTVYVAHDDRITTKPSWMSSFTDTGDDIESTDFPRSVFSQDFPTGTVTLGGNGGSSASSMYSVIVEGSGQTTPTCGDTNCDTGECNTCPGDCSFNECCPDGTCNNGETCSTCDQDCGACPISGACNDIVLLMHFDNQAEYGETPSHFYDFSGNGYNGSCSGSSCPTLNPSGRFGGAYDFDDTDDFIDLGSDFYDTTDEYTITAWVNASALEGYIYAKRSDTKPFQSSLYVEDDGRLTAYIGSVNFPQTQNPVIQTGKWQFVTMTKSGTSVHFYVDGQAVATVNPTTSGDETDSTNPAYIGSRYQARSQHFFSGMIDEFAIWNRTLTTQEIRDLYNSGAAISCEVQYHRADTNRNCIIELDELLAFINRWKVSSLDVPMTELMEAIGLWNSGTGC
jgi:hypothetical protein